MKSEKTEETLFNLEYVKCNLCGSKSFKTLFTKGDSGYYFKRTNVYDIEYSVVKCKNCSMTFLNPRPTSESMSQFYENSFYDEMIETKTQLSRYETEMKYLAGLKPGKLLDVGCSAGASMEIASKKGWDVYGTDLFASKIKSKYNLKIKYGKFSEIQYPSNHFDVVTSWAVFEHLHDPQSYFEKVSDVLKKNGKFIFLVPNINSIGSRLAYEEDIPRHIQFFSKKTVKQYLIKNGFSNIKIKFDDQIYRLDGTTLFQQRIMRLFINSSKIGNPNLSLYLKALSFMLFLLGYILIKPTVYLQKLLGIYGIMVVTCEKN